MRARQDEDNDDSLDRPSIDTCCWDPGCQNGLHLLLLHPTLLHRDATTTDHFLFLQEQIKDIIIMNISLPQINPRFNTCSEASDEDNDDSLDRPSIDTCCWDPGCQNGLHLLLLHPTILHRDATTTELNIRVPNPPLNPSASMRARQDEDNDDSLDRPSIDT
jgi:hypothetical protein